MVSKLLTGFDAPRNIVIYLCKELKEHSLLQAIARVNRLHEDKDYGFVVDYVGLLGAGQGLDHVQRFEGLTRRIDRHADIGPGGGEKTAPALLRSLGPLQGN